MTIGITPQTSFPTAVFYDPNNNPQNIPCEGPKIVQINLTPAIDTSYTVDFSYLQQKNAFTCVQGVFVDLGDANGSNSNVTIISSGSNQRIVVTSQVISKWINLTAVSPAHLTITTTAAASFIANGTVRLTFYNYVVYPFATSATAPI